MASTNDSLPSASTTRLRSPSFPLAALVLVTGPPASRFALLASAASMLAFVSSAAFARSAWAFLPNTFPKSPLSLIRALPRVSARTFPYWVPSLSWNLGSSALINFLARSADSSPAPKSLAPPGPSIFPSLEILNSEAILLI